MLSPRYLLPTSTPGATSHRASVSRATPRNKDEYIRRTSPDFSSFDKVMMASDTSSVATSSLFTPSDQNHQYHQRPSIPSSPVQIPTNSKTTAAHFSRHPKRHEGSRHRGARPAHDPTSVSPSVAALLAMTSIPPSKAASLRKKASEQRISAVAIMEQSQEAEKEFSLSLDDGGSKSPLQILLDLPDELDSDGISITDSLAGSTRSTRTISMDSIPSLSESVTTGMASSLDSARTTSRGRGRKSLPTRRSLTPVSSPGGGAEDHPLSNSSYEVEDLDFRVFQPAASLPEKRTETRSAFLPLKSAFKSNLTASLRALRNAARSFSNMNLTSIPPEDFLTRSLLTLDPRIPYTDERRPPPLEDEPSAELRRYLNPTTVRSESPTPNTAPASARGRTAFTASIQMQTYKVHRPRSPARVSVGSAPGTSQSEDSKALDYPLPGPRQRELRENSDFIRIAVMEMAMRRKGKLDDRKPGRARLALPPRKTSAQPYEIRSDGVPARWVAVVY